MGIGKDFSIVMGWRGGLVWEVFDEGEEGAAGMMRMRTLIFRKGPPIDVGCGGGCGEKNLFPVDSLPGSFLGVGIGFDGDGNITMGVRTVIESSIPAPSRVSI